MSDTGIAFLITFMLGVGFVVGMLLGTTIQQDFERGKATRANAAHYACNEKTGKCEFTWGPR